MKVHNIDDYAALMAKEFLDDPGVKRQLSGIADGMALLTLQCRCQFAAFEKVNGVAVRGDGKGMTMGYFTKDEEKLMQYLQEESSYLVARVSSHDLMTLQKNAQKVAQIVRPDWYMAYVGEREVYVLQVVVLHSELRGTGAFRTLLTPILEEAEKRGSPVVLQTHVKDHVLKYQHMGFQLMETEESEEKDLSCYNMLKNFADKG